MSIAIDHVGIPAADPWAAARFLRAILAEGEVTPAGPDGEMASLSIGDGALTYFGLAAHEPHSTTRTGTCSSCSSPRLPEPG